MQISGTFVLSFIIHFEFYTFDVNLSGIKKNLYYDLYNPNLDTQLINF